MLSDFLNSINQTKENILKKNENLEKEYVPYVINKCFSYFPETILHASAMNTYCFLDKHIQYDYYLYVIPKKKRFSKWIKPEKEEKIALIKQIYGYSDIKAREVADMLDLNVLKELTQKGGQKR